MRKSSILKGLAVIPIAACALLFYNFKGATKSRDGILGVNESPVPHSALESNLSGKAISAAKRNTSGKSTLTPEQAKLEIEKILATTPDITKRSAACADIISALCKNGFTEEAWNLIDKGYGAVRDSQLAAFFSAGELERPALLSKMEELKGEEITPAMLGYMYGLKGGELMSALTLPEFKKFAAELRAKKMLTSLDAAISVSLSGQFREGDQTGNLAILEDAAFMRESGLVSATTMLYLITKADTGDSFKNWDYITKIDQKEQENPRAQKMRVQVVSDLVHQDASKALGLLVDVPGKQGIADLSNALEAWTNIDATGASKWVFDNQGSLSEDKQMAIANAMFTKALTFKQFDTAKQWADTVSDPNMKANMLKALDAWNPKKEFAPAQK